MSGVNVELRKRRKKHKNFVVFIEFCTLILLYDPENAGFYPDIGYTMGTPRKWLWELVHSLTAAETIRLYERAFQAKRGRYPNYMILFEAIRDQKEFDDDDLRKKLEDYPFAKKLTRTKNYLYNKILDFVPGEPEDKESELFNRVARIKFLFEKRHFHQLPEQIAVAVKLAEEMEDFFSHLRILHYERELLLYQRNWGDYGDEVRSIKAKERQIDEKHRQRLTLTQWRDEILSVPRTKVDQKRLTEVKNRLDSLGAPNSASSKILIAQIRYYLALRTKDYEDCIRQTDKIRKVIQEKPLLIQDYSKFKTFVMATYYGAMLRLLYNRFVQAQEVFNQMITIAKADEREPYLFIERRIQFNIEVGRKTFNYPKIESAISEFESVSSSKPGALGPTVEIELCLSICNVLIIWEKPRQALKYILRMPGIKPVQARNDIKHFSRILFLVAHYDLGNIEIIEQGIKAARISFARKRIDSPYYKGVLRLFSKLLKAVTPTERKNAFRSFLDEFQGRNKDYFRSMNNYFDIESWSRSKIEQRPFIEILKGEYNKRS